MIKKCENCGREFETVLPQKKYCSQKCLKKVQLERIHEIQRQNRQLQVRIKKVCEICGREFETVLPNRKYCSNRCKQRGYVARAKQRKESGEYEKREKSERKAREWTPALRRFFTAIENFILEHERSRS